uniref:Uncharacterized protein n=1 Tax=Zea mays TaxID=4577 RepID=C4IZN9_MAIZE|nr:unknown [Zea mays]ACR36823.1 unknown [Zea mays]
MSAASTTLPSRSLVRQPMKPMSATCTWAQLLGHPVQCMRTGRGTATRFSTSRATCSARALVSMMACPQNWLPVHATRPRSSSDGCGERRCRCSSGSASSASSLRLLTLGSTTFCSTVSRSSPVPYSSARRASSNMSAACSRPTGTCRPTYDRPSCFCGCTPR